jgi:cobalt-zinc-cadmium efflux system membrane fusion protein
MRRSPAIAAALAIAALGAACDRAKPPPPTVADAAAGAPPEVRVDPELVRSGRITTAVAEVRAPLDEVSIPGEVDSGERGEAQVTALVTGRVASLDGTPGQPVKAGQTLCVVDSPEVGRAQADVLRAHSRALLAQRALARQLELEAQGATSKSAIDQARAEEAASRSELIAARSMLSNLGVTAADADSGASTASNRVAMRSPIDGVVIERSAVLGGPVLPGATLFRIVAPGTRIVVAKLPETQVAARADEGTPVRLLPRSGPARPDAVACAGTIERNLRVVDDTRAVPLRIRIDGACDVLAVGSYVDVRLPTRSSSATADASAALLVPASAVADVRGFPTVFLTTESEGRFQARRVRKGATWGSDVAIEAGLAPGDRVATSGVLLLKGELLRGEMQP